MNKSLYNITSEHLHHLKMIEDVEKTLDYHGEDASQEVLKDLQEKLELGEEEKDFKAIAYLEVIRTKEAEIKMAKEEIKRLQGYVKSRQSLIDRLKDNLVTAIKVFGEFNVGTHSFKIRKSESVVVNSLEDLILYDESLVEVVTTHKPDKKAIKEAIKAGDPVEGAYIETKDNLNAK